MRENTKLLLFAVVWIGIVLGVIFLVPANKNLNDVAPPLTFDNNNTISNGDIKERSRFEETVSYLTSLGVSEERVLRLSGTPQNSAALFMADQDALAYEIVVDAHDVDDADDLAATSRQQSSKNKQSNITSHRFVQRYVLVVFYFATTAHPDGWENPIEFLTATDECAWNALVTTMPDYDVLTTLEQMSVGVACNSELRVTSLFLPNNRLKGSLPLELSFLTDLTVVGLHRNQLTGNLPSEWESATWPNLLYFNVHSNTLAGTVPEYFGKFSHLEVLGLDCNNFTGSIPSSLRTLSNLTTLGASQNQFTGTLDFAINSWTSLKYFFVSHNSLTGTVVGTFAAVVPEEDTGDGTLIQVDLSHNLFHGPVPLNTLFKHHQSLEVIHLAHNQFSGTFPELVATDIVNTLQFISLRNNQLTGSLPKTIGLLGAQFRHLDVHDNAMTGYIPNELGAVVDLEYLYLGGNHFDANTTQSLPPLSQLSELHELSLSRLNMTGPVPAWLQFLPQLQYLDLSHNALTGTIPETLWNLPLLSVLFVHDNDSLNGTWPPLMDGTTQLEVVTLYETDLVFLHVNDTEDSSSAVCRTNITVFVDCTVDAPGIGCTKSSAPSALNDDVDDDICWCLQQLCCNTNNDTSSCAANVVSAYADGFDFTPDAFAYFPNILDDASLFDVRH